MAMIGQDATPKKDVKYASSYKRLAHAANLFELAESVASDDRPLVHKNERLNTLNYRSDITVYTFSDIPLSDSHRLVLAVGRPETGFYQVPVIKIIGGKGKDGVDVMVSGTINEKGKAESYKEPKKLSEMSKKFYDGCEMKDVNRVYAVALVPKSDVLGEEVVIGGIGGRRILNQPLYHMIVNGFALERKIVGPAGYEASYLSGMPHDFVPVMYPSEDGKEKFLKLSDILDQKAVQKLESEGIFPGLTFVAGEFRRQREISHLGIEFYDELSAPVTLGAGFRGATKGAGERAGVGRVGLEEGSDSDVRYGKITGDITSIDGVLALHFLGIEEGTNPDQIKAEIEKLVPK